MKTRKPEPEREDKLKYMDYFLIPHCKVQIDEERLKKYNLIEVEKRVAHLVGVSNLNSNPILTIRCNFIKENAGLIWEETNYVTPILRKLPQITEEEVAEMMEQIYNDKSALSKDAFVSGVQEIPGFLSPQIFVLIIRKHFDLFNWIEKGFALQEETITETII